MNGKLRGGIVGEGATGGVLLGNSTIIEKPGAALQHRQSGRRQDRGIAVRKVG
jgi:hypothetical protein